MTTVAIIGAGSVGLGTAALFASYGHDVRLFSRSAPPISMDFILSANGKLEWKGTVKACSRLEVVIPDAEIIILCVPADAQKETIDTLVSHITSGQTVVVSAQYSMSALYLSKRLFDRNLQGVLIAAMSTTFVAGRRQDPHSVWVTTVRTGNLVATYGGQSADDLIAEQLEGLSGQKVKTVSMTEIIFSNPNPVVHAPNALCNLTRIENGEEWSNWGMLTESVCAIVEQLDAERLTAAKQFGSEPKSLAQHLHDSFGNTIGSIHEMCMQNAAARGGLKGPSNLSTRYITEDIPFGLLPMALLSELGGIKAETHEALISLLSIACRREFATENSVLPELRLKDMSKSELLKKMRDGWREALAAS